ncbi:MAG TPA: SUMF1/EgtB/PvdO family nonheme iron enzyme [Nitrospirales bacterium]|nr:SUMF1/EgtB/PvdO family nonheme iron enzyme [Nitrospirales bacterium]
MWPLVKIHSVIGLLGFLSWVGMMPWSESVMAQDLDSLKAGVVKITAINPNRIGTGVIVGVKDRTAYIATASHVIEGDPLPQVTFYQDRSHSYPAKIQGMEGGNPKGLAALVVEGDLPSGIRPLPFHVEGKLTGGEKVTVIGFPRLVPVPWAVAEATITGLVWPDLIFTGPVEEGNSGGPLLSNGKIVGLITEVAGSYKYAKPAVIAQYELKNWELVFSDSSTVITSTVISSAQEQPTVQPKSFGTLPSASSPENQTGLDGPPMVLIQPGSFKMGDWPGRGDEDERPVHEVRLPRTFAMGQYEVTFAEYDHFARATGRILPDDEGWGRGHRPVINVSWEDAKAYAQWLSEQTRKGYRLPTEAEWEFAARSGGKEEVWAGTSEERQVRNYAVYQGDKTAEVGNKQPNGLGLYDMSGNVWEWVEDCWHGSYQGAPTNGAPWLEADGGDCGRRVIRGGSWDDVPVNLRTSFRIGGPTVSRYNFVGFRLAQDIP